jgi:cytochrome c peroxidase
MRYVLVIVLLACGCNTSDPGPGTDVDAGGNNSMVRPVGISDTLWTTMQKVSPEGGYEPPEDPTNKYAGDPDAELLGHYVFYETAISGNGEVSCASCHDPEHGFSGPEPLAIEGILGEEHPTARHTPGLLNVAYNDWFFWDGRVDTLWGQAIGPMEHPVEMGGSRLQLAHYVYDTPQVKQAYEKIFGALPDPATLDPFPAQGRPVADPQTPEEQAHADAWMSMEPEDREAVTLITVNVMKAVAAFEMRLISVDSPFDQWVEQVRENPEDPEQWDAIDDDAREGFRLFMEVVGCSECHNGPMLHDGKFYNLGLPERDGVDAMDVGRWNGLRQAKESPFRSSGKYSDAPDGERAIVLDSLPQQEKNNGAFRTASLRNLMVTDPYMHGGHFDSLDDVLSFYNDQPDGFPLVGGRTDELRELNLKEEHIAKIKAFLQSLQGKPVPGAYLEQPDSPLAE